MHRLFVYGTLRHPPLLDGLVGRPVTARTAWLPGYRAAGLRGRPYPGLVVDADGRAAGAVVEVDDDGLAVLDRFEGAEYTRVPVTVETGDGAIEAQTYLLTGPSRSLVEARTWDLRAFVDGDAGRWVRDVAPGTRHPGADVR